MAEPAAAQKGPIERRGDCIFLRLVFLRFVDSSRVCDLICGRVYQMAT